jgi:hypothetical protein
MNRKVATALTAAALFASVSVSAALAGVQNGQAEQPAPKVVRTGQKQKKVSQHSCPIHPEVKARTPGKCPKCRMEERKQKEAQQKEKDKQKELGGAAVNE